MAKQQDRKAKTAAATSIPIEAVARRPLPGMIAPGMLAFSPDDKLITYLFSPEGDLTRQLYAFDPETGEVRLLITPAEGGVQEEKLSLDEILRRERQRQLELGVTHYAWAKYADRLLVPLQGEIYVKEGAEGPLHKVVESDGSPLLDPQLSPNGKWVAYVQDAEVHLVPAEGGKPRQLTWGAHGTGRTNGLAEFIAQEEMGRSRGFWWSRDSRSIAFIEVDETHIPGYRIVHQGQAKVGETAQEDHRYPFAGAANAKVRLGIVSLAKGETVWMDLDPEEDLYLARVEWLPDGSLSAQLENRAQNRLELVRFDPISGKRKTLLQETSEVWINLHDMFRPLEDDRFIWASERTGFRHLYLYDRQGQLIRPLTAGEWMVDAIAGVDETRGLVYFTATREGPTESHLYAVSFEEDTAEEDVAGNEPRRITAEPGMHSVVVGHEGRCYIDTHQALDRPPTVTLRSLIDGSLLRTIYENKDPYLNELALEPPELVSMQSRDGVTLYGAIYRPPASFGQGPYPAIVAVYGGPHAQLVTNSWAMTVNMRAQYLRQQGFLVFTLDNRGSARRGLAFEGAIKHNMGDIEVRDQVDGVRWLVDRGLADPARVGVYGWSYGGYMAAMCLARAPETFKVAVAGAPVTHWDGYDTHYTERYMGLPQDNVEGYEVSSVMHHVENIRGRLMLVHGLIDENVHFRHTARLINALIRARKRYDLLLFPDERHLPRKLEDRVFMEEQICDYFTQHLLE